MPRSPSITHDVSKGGTYNGFITELRELLAEHNDMPRHYIRDLSGRIHHVLPKQTYPKEPRRWIYIKLVLPDEGAETTLVVRDDNVYLKGFKNKRRELFEFGFSGTIEPKKKSQRLLQGSRFLECDEDYGSLLGHGGPRNFPRMRLGRSFAREAVRQLSGYSQGEGCSVDDKTKELLAGLIAMVCEATRMSKLQEKAGWHTECCRIETKQVNYIRGWGDMSEALLRWKRDPGFEFPKCLKDIGVQGPNKALEIVELLLNTPIDRPPRWRLEYRRPYQRPAAGDDDARRSEQQRRAAGDRGHPSEKRQPAAGEHGSGSGQQQSSSNKRKRTERQHGQEQPPPDKGCEEWQQETPPEPPAVDYVASSGQLAEVFAVRAGFHFVGTIAVFDGVRGQVIYENNGGAAPITHGSGDDDQPRALLLTGPYRAISAYGSFTIEVDISGAGAAEQDQGARDVGELYWNCYKEDNAYDTLLRGTITTSISRRQVKVIYAVLSDAVDAELAVHLRLPRATDAQAGRGTVVYGKIATRSKALSDSSEAWSVLFDSMDKGVSLVADSNGSITRLPLARSVVAMPVGSPLQIKATLYDALPSSGVSPVFQCEDKEVTLGSPLVDGEFKVSITSPDYYPRPTPIDTATPRRRSTNHYDSCPY